MQELRENFSLAELFNFAKKKFWGEWLEMNYYFNYAKKLSEAELKLFICKIFSLNFDALTADELEKISALIGKNLFNGDLA